jgi:general secretion pathway protein G
MHPRNLPIAATVRDTARTPSRRPERGFTLVELMVVIVILGGLIALVGPKVFTALGKAGRSQAETQMHNFSEAIKLYYMEHRKYPQSLEALTEENPKTGESWMDSIPKDPWDSPYDYRPSGKKFKIISYGEDQQEGTADDIVYPPEGAQGD